MEKRSKIIVGIIIFNLIFLFITYLYQQKLNEVVTEDIKFENIPEVTKNIIEFNGLYQKHPMDSNLNIAIDFKQNSVSLWIVKMGDITDTIAKKFEVKGTELFVTHDIEKMKNEIEKYSKKGNNEFANTNKEAINSMQKTDKYTISINRDSTITLSGKTELVIKKVQ